MRGVLLLAGALLGWAPFPAEAQGLAPVFQRVNGSVVAKSAATATILPNTMYQAQLTYDGVKFSLTVDGNPVLTLTPTAVVPSGSVGFAVKNSTGSFSQIVVQ